MGYCNVLGLQLCIYSDLCIYCVFILHVLLCVLYEFSSSYVDVFIIVIIIYDNVQISWDEFYCVSTQGISCYPRKIMSSSVAMGLKTV